MFCPNCGANCAPGVTFCPHCGAALSANPQPIQPAPVVDPFGNPGSVSSVLDEDEFSHKSPSLTFFFCWFFGTLGIHDYYAGKPGLGIAKVCMIVLSAILVGIAFAAKSMDFIFVATIILCVCTAIVELWVYIDMIRISFGVYRDGQGKRIRKCIWGIIISVVIPLLVVVLGVAGAVAVPKMFGMAAKSKASEVIPAMSEYKVLQEAYYVEKGRMGNASQIGYQPPQSQNFTYEATKRGIVATSKEKLNDCPAGSQWILVGETDYYSSSITWIAKVVGAYGDSYGCEALTPSFNYLAQ